MPPGDRDDMESRRASGKEGARIEMRTSAGEDITGQGEQERSGGVLFAEHLFSRDRNYKRLFLNFGDVSSRPRGFP